MDNHYDILGVAVTATEADLKQAYRKLAMRWHPDRHANGDQAHAEQRFKQCKEAYETLSEPGKRRAHDDALRSAGRFPKAKAQSADDAAFESVMAGWAESFRDLRGAAAKADEPEAEPQYDTTNDLPPERGVDAHIPLPLSIEEAFGGVDYALALDRDIPCAFCKGEGGFRRNTPCHTCHGNGNVQRRNGSKYGTCDSCGGTGKQTKKCEACRGKGHKVLTREYVVKVPPGVLEGTVLSLAGAGGEGKNGGPSGNLICTVTILPHPVFQIRNRCDLEMPLEIDPITSILGGKQWITGLRGRILVDLPPMTKAGSLLKIANEGLEIVNEHHIGALLLRIGIGLPEWVRNLTPTQLRILDEIRSQSLR